MGENETATATCRWCGASLSPSHIGPCPKCGKEGKKLVSKMEETMKIKDAFSWERRREFFEVNRKIKWLIIAITIGSPLVGFIVSGLVGFIIGLILSFISYLLGPFAVTKVREIERGSS